MLQLYISSRGGSCCIVTTLTEVSIRLTVKVAGKSTVNKHSKHQGGSGQVIIWVGAANTKTVQSVNKLPVKISATLSSHDLFASHTPTNYTIMSVDTGGKVL